MGRPSLAPGRYFRLLLVGYVEDIDSERGIAWRAAHSLSDCSRGIPSGSSAGGARAIEGSMVAHGDRCEVSGGAVVAPPDVD